MTICQADGSVRSTMGSAYATLHLGTLEEPTHFTIFDVACEADLILGYGWLRSHDLQFLYASSAISICADRDCVSGRRVCLDLLDPLSVPSLPSSISVAELHRMLGAAHSETGTDATGSLTDGVARSLEDLATDGFVTLSDGTALQLGQLAYCAAEEQFALPPDLEDPPEYVDMAREVASVLAGPPPTRARTPCRAPAQ